MAIRQYSVKALIPGAAGAAKYKEFAVPDLPTTANGAGIRPGACNMLSACMPAELAAHFLKKIRQAVAVKKAAAVLLLMEAARPAPSSNGRLILPIVRCLW